MANSAQEFSGKTTDEAIAEGLRQLGLQRDDVEIEILSRGSRGILGFGSEPAVVRIIPRRSMPAADTPSPVRRPTAIPEAPQPPSPAEDSADLETAAPVAAPPTPAAQEAPAQPAAGDPYADEPSDFAEEDEELAHLAVSYLTKMVELMGFDAQVEPAWRVAEEEGGGRYLLLDIRGADLGALIGRRGETLANIQYLLRLMVNQRLKQWKNIVVDVEQYKERRVTQLTQLANRMAEQVATSHRAISLEPMPANERRIIHLTLRDHPSVYTESSGEGDRRKVSIVPRP